jgi:hypothetical protein
MPLFHAFVWAVRKSFSRYMFRKDASLWFWNIIEPDCLLHEWDMLARA